VSRLILAAVVAGMLAVGCAEIRPYIDGLLGMPPVKDVKAFGEAVADRDWPAAHDTFLRIQDTYVAIMGANTIEEEYGSECTSAMSMFFVSGNISTVKILRDSPITDLIESVGSLRTVYAVTIGPRVIHVGKGHPLDLVHEVSHIVQWESAQSTFPLQYLPTVILMGSEGYRASVFEQDAIMQSWEFQKEYGDVCEQPIGAPT